MAIAERFQGANIIDAGRLSPYWGEHAARYVFALPYVTGKSVLDIACGTGYGLALLKRSAKRVTGVDVDFDAIMESKREWDENTGAMLGDGLNLPFKNESFDVVTSFETLEHLRERGKFLSELKRVLKKTGLLILSTPNANYTKPINGKPSNPFHIFEYTPGELKTELNQDFVVQELLGQTLAKSFGIPPFHDAQLKLPRNFSTQTKLIGWKILNKMPFDIRESVSKTVWNRPFYPTETDYEFGPDRVHVAPVLMALCRKAD